MDVLVELTPERALQNPAAIRSPCSDRNGFEPREGHRPFCLPDAESTLGARFYEAAVVHANRHAIVDEAGEAVSYEELLQRSLHIAGGLLARVKDGEQPIVLVASQSIAAAEAILGTLLAGLPYLPVDPSLPAAELARICAAAHPAAVLSTAVGGHGPSVAGIPSLDLAELLQARPLDGARSVSPHQAAALFATSGTTGTPKLVALSHRAILFDIGRQTNDLYLGPDDRFDLLFSTGFSASLAPLFAALLNGAELHPLDLRGDREGGAPRLLDWIEDREITISNMTTSTFRLAAATAPSSDRCPHLRLLSLSGERVSIDDLAGMRRIIGHQCVLQNAMASTETRTYAQYFVAADSHAPDPLPIGWPVWGKDVLLLDDEGRALSGPGEGEVAIRSSYLASGYINDPLQTAERFQPHGDDLTVFRTGDLASRSQDGCLTFLGRSDARVKVRGYRVELDAVEAAMRQCDGVQECAVVASQDSSGSVSLAAFYTSAPGALTTQEGLRLHLEKELPAYMNPASICRVEKMPRGTNGKVDRQHLRRLSRRRTPAMTFADAASIEEDASTVEKLVALARSILPDAATGPDEPLFQNAIDSLGLIQFLLLVEERFGVRLSPQLIRERSTLRELARTLEEKLSPSGAATQAPGRPQVVPLPGQGPKAPIYFVHPVTGSADVYYPLAELMQMDRPVFGVHAPAYTASDDGLTIEVIASRYLEAVRESLDSLATDRTGQREVIFAGYSFGGAVAYEMARQFAAAGAGVPPVVIVDLPAYSPQRSSSRIVLDACRNLPSWLRYNGLRQSPRELLHRVVPAIRWLCLPSRRNRRYSAGDFRLPPTYDRPLQIMSEAVAKYAPLPYRGKVVVLRLGTLLRSPDPSMGWAAVAADVSSSMVPGTHNDCLAARNLPEFTEALQRHLEALDIPEAPDTRDTVHPCPADIRPVSR